MTLRDAEPAAMSVPIARAHSGSGGSNTERGCYFIDRECRRERAVRDRFLDCRQPRLEPGVRFEAQVKPVLEHRPHPLDLLLAPSRGEFARRAQLLAMCEHLLP